MEKLQWFKFSHTDWIMGKIQRCPEITQARFVRLCCLYWNKETNVSVKDAIIEIDKDHFDILVNKDIIKIDDEHIFIDFLDTQYINIIETSKKARESVNKRWNKRNTTVIQNDTSVLLSNEVVIRNDTDKIREDKIREDIHTKFDFKKSCVSLGVDENLINDWLIVRKNKKASNTETAFNVIKKQIELCSIKPNECIKIAVENSWSGFKAEWLKSIDLPLNKLSNDEQYAINVMAQINKYK